MIIICEKCKTKFNVDDRLIKSEGSVVECYNCSYRWLQKPEHQFEQNILDKIYNSANNDKKGGISKLLVILMVLVLVAAFVAYKKGLFTNAGDLIGIFQSDKRIKKIENLNIKILKPVELMEKEGKEYLVVKGYIENKTNTVKKIPGIIVDLKNDQEKMIRRIQKSLEDNEVAPFSKVDFVFVLERFSEAITVVEVNFDKEEN